MTLTPAELTVLGLIIEQPRHGYDLEQTIEDRGIRQWTDIGFSSIYYLLTKLETRGLIEAATCSGAKSRRVFEVTAKGQQVAVHEARAFIADARAVPNPLLVGLSNSSLIGERGYDAALRSRLAQVDVRYMAIVNAQQSQAPLPIPAREVFSYTLSMLEAERSWLAERVKDLP